MFHAWDEVLALEFLYFISSTTNSKQKVFFKGKVYFIDDSYTLVSSSARYAFKSYTVICVRIVCYASAQISAKPPLMKSNRVECLPFSKLPSCMWSLDILQ